MCWRGEGRGEKCVAVTFSFLAHPAPPDVRIYFNRSLAAGTQSYPRFFMILVTRASFRSILPLKLSARCSTGTRTGKVWISLSEML